MSHVSGFLMRGRASRQLARRVSRINYDRASCSSTRGGSSPLFLAQSPLHPCQSSTNSLTCEIRRDQSGLSSLTSWARDVVRTGSLRPSNPVLRKPESPDSASEEGSVVDNLPEFSRMQPYHLKSASQETARQYKVDFAELEVAITDHKDISVMKSLDQMEASVTQLVEVGQLFTELASTPDQLNEWSKAHEEALNYVDKLPWRNSKIVYQALLKESKENSDASIIRRPVLLDFEKQGVQFEPDSEESNRLRGLEREIQSLKGRLQNVTSYSTASKQTRLQIVSDMYNMVGMSQIQAQMLGYENVMEMDAASSPRFISPKEAREMSDEVAIVLKPHLPETKVTLDAGAGAFLGSRNDSDGPTEEDKEMWRAKHSVKNLLCLHGVLAGVADFCEAMFGIKVEIVKENSLGWNKNVQLVHLYDIADNNGGDGEQKETSKNHIGTIYLDAYKDPYFRPESANDLVMTRLFTQRQAQGSVPISVIALKANPTWDDAPTPLTWEDTRDFLYQFGKAVQLILSQQSSNNGAIPPVDTSEFMAIFFELWLQNDGFLQRLAQLSQDQFTFQPELVEMLQKDLKQQKAQEVMRAVYLGMLELNVFTDFDPRGDETLAALAERLANQYIPHDAPDSSDLSLLLDVFQDSADENIGGIKVPAYSSVCSEVLACTMYHKFQNTDLRDREEATRLGRGIRGFFSRDTTLQISDVEELSGYKVSSDFIGKVYNFKND